MKNATASDSPTNTPTTTDSAPAATNKPRRQNRRPQQRRRADWDLGTLRGKGFGRAAKDEVFSLYQEIFPVDDARRDVTVGRDESCLHTAELVLAHHAAAAQASKASGTPGWQAFASFEALKKRIEGLAYSLAPRGNRSGGRRDGKGAPRTPKAEAPASTEPTPATEPEAASAE